jgi:2-methylcitrate dehydratase PrpD
MDAAALFARNFKQTVFDDLSAEIVEITKKQILDALGVIVAGAPQPAAREIRELVEEWGGREDATILGGSRKVPAPHAAQVNATMMHSRDYDDVHEVAVMHPGVATIPVGLAIAELKGGFDGKELITSVALGTDLICRLGLATRPGVSAMKTGWHFTTLYAFPTSAITAGRLMGLSEDKLINAFGIAYHQCGGNGQCVKDSALTKRMGPGFSVRGGIMSALLAEKGVTGAKNCLEGENGLFAVYHCGGYDGKLLTHDLGKYFEGINVSFKPYPCCRGVHPSIDAALSVVNEHDVKPQDVAQIEIVTGEGNHMLLCTPFEKRVRPTNEVDAQFSIPWGVAVAIANRKVTTDDYTKTAMGRKEFLDLTAKIAVGVDRDMKAGEEMEPARVTITTKGGQAFSASVSSPLGSRRRPMSYADFKQKFEDCLALGGKQWSSDKVERVVDWVAGLESVKDVREIIGLMV